MLRSLFIVALSCVTLASVPFCAEAQALKGIVWETPESTAAAIRDLRAMKEAGVEVIRTGPLVDSALLTEADSLGLVFYREIPILDTPARTLTDSMALVRRGLEHILDAGRNHTSAGPIGLAVTIDVSRRDVCSFFDLLRSSVTASDQRFYYVSRFIESDTCTSSVDFVILDAVGYSDPQHLISRWRSSQSSEVGIIIGKRIEVDSDSGLQEPFSEESQARFYESSLTQLNDSAGVKIIFIHRWRDQPVDQYDRSYGLHGIGPNKSDHQRLSLGVVRGIFTGTQTVFAFNGDASVSAPSVWFTMLGWLLILIVAALYTSSPRFRDMTPRYFMAHGFYRNAVREAREVLPIVSTALLTVAGLATGMIATQILLAVHETAAFMYMVRLAPDTVQSTITVLLDSPLVATIFIGSISLLAMTLWMGLWMIVAGQRPPLLPSQALMLAVWPRWQLLLMLPVAMAIATLEPGAEQTGFLLLYPVWAGVSLWAGARTAYDIFKLTNCSPLIAVIGLLLHPSVLLLMSVLAIMAAQGDHVLHVLHLVFRS
ncbi:MAG: hypothetical protein E2O84_08235 [Bacteroidetes bacterium]|nr:MAG: hypothetical protein E2O84_08235 [Bacteroidota bacterium]